MAPLVVFLFVVLIIVGAAVAAGGKGKGKSNPGQRASESVDSVSQWLADQADATRDAGDDVAHRVAGDATPGSTGGGAYAALVTGGSGMLLVAMRVARRSRQVIWRPANAFEAGRVRAYGLFATTGAEAMEGIARLRGIGGVAAWEVEGEAARVEMEEKRRASCEEVAGFLAGAFETVWGRDVHVTHDSCGRKTRGAVCTYHVKAVHSAPTK